MAQIDLNLNLYKTPSNEILRHRKKFYGLWKRCDDKTGTWLDRIQNQIEHCEFPPLLSREYLLIDKFVCELDDAEREFIRSVNTWTLMELVEYIEHRKVNTSYGVQSTNSDNNTAIKQNEQHQMPTFVAVKCEFDGYEYAENTTNIEIVKEENTFNQIKLEPCNFDNEEDSSVYVANGNATTCAATDQFEPDFDIIGGGLIEGMQLKSEDCRFAVNDIATPVTATATATATGRINKNDSTAAQSNRKRYACDQCDKSYVWSSHLSAHKKSIHQGIRSYACDYCDKRFIASSNLKNHLLVHTGEKPFACDQCEKSFTELRTLNKHKKNIHQGIRAHLMEHSEVLLPHQCDQCNECFYSDAELNQHSLTHMGPNSDTVNELQIDDIKCEIENYEYLAKDTPIATQTGNDSYVSDCSLPIEPDQSVQDRQSHIQLSSLNSPKKIANQRILKHTCTHCEKPFPSASNLERHLRTHTGEKPFECYQCNKKFTELSNLKKHFHTHTGEKLFACDQCTKSFGHPCSLSVHKRVVHKALRSYTCDICNKQFIRYPDIKRHIILVHVPDMEEKSQSFPKKNGARTQKTTVHDENRTFACDQCDQRFLSISHRQAHVCMHIGKRQFTCEQCNKSFIRLRNLNAHQITHKAVKPFACDQCDKTFNRADNLKVHKDATHHGIRAFACVQCDKRFARNSYLQRHLQWHTGLKPFVCDICNKSFGRLEFLRNHFLVHTGEKPFSCEHCDKSFAQRSNYRKHKKIVHEGK